MPLQTIMPIYYLLTIYYLSIIYELKWKNWSVEPDLMYSWSDHPLINWRNTCLLQQRLFILSAVILACFPHTRPVQGGWLVIPSPIICPLPKVEPEPVYGISLNMEWLSCSLRILCVLISIFPTADKTNLTAVRTSGMGMAVYYAEISSAIGFINVQVLQGVVWHTQSNV
jgi:hypothetical protein